MIYLLQTILYTSLMLAIYIAVLRNKPTHAFNRFYLLLSGVVPLLLPFIYLPETLQNEVSVIDIPVISLPAVMVGEAQSLIAPSYNWWWTVYSAVAVSILTMQLWNYYKLYKVIARSQKEKHDSYTILKHSGFGPGSFGRYMFIPEEEIDNKIKEHELIHIKQRHTADIVFLNLMQIVFWPNLLLIWLRKELKQVHEFQADAYAGQQRENYMQLLLSSVFNGPASPMIHTFIIHPIKRRIMMLNKNISPVRNRLTRLMALVMLLLMTSGVILLQSCKKETEKKAVSENQLDLEEMKKPVKMENGELLYTFVDQMPVFPGDEGAFSRYMAESIKYPEEADKNGIERQVILSFMIAKDGSIQDIEVKKSPDASLSQAAIKAVEGMPRWIPGEKDGEPVNVKFTLPVMFKK